MEKPCLNNPDVFPDDEVLAQHLGIAKKTWDTFVEDVRKNPALTLVDWKFYHDGKTWLSRVMKKKKTICWISIWPKFFKVTFYFSNPSNEIKKITASINESIKKQWAKDNQGKKFWGITIQAKKKSDVNIIRQMIDVKAEIV